MGDRAAYISNDSRRPIKQGGPGRGGGSRHQDFARLQTFKFTQVMISRTGPVARPGLAGKPRKILEPLFGRPGNFQGRLTLACIILEIGPIVRGGVRRRCWCHSFRRVFARPVISAFLLKPCKADFNFSSP